MELDWQRCFVGIQIYCTIDLGFWEFLEPGNPNPGVGPDLKVSSCGLTLWFTSQPAPYDGG